MWCHLFILDLVCGSTDKESACYVEDLGLIPGLGRYPGEGKDYPTPVFWPREFLGLYGPWSRKELDMTERLNNNSVTNQPRPLVTNLMGFRHSLLRHVVLTLLRSHLWSVPVLGLGPGILTPGLVFLVCTIMTAALEIPE